MNRYYLAYGMNTSLQSMKARCPKAKSLGKVTLNGHKLAFKHFCDVLVDPKSSMECALWSITDECEASLDILEGFPTFYGKKEVKVQHNGRTIIAMIYFMRDTDRLQMPSEGYLKLVSDGYTDHSMNISQIINALEELTVCTL